MTALVELLAHARRAGLTLSQKDDRLVIRGDRAHGRLVSAILERKHDVLAVVAIYNGTAGRLDWRREPILGDFQPCALCHRLTLLIEPYDGRPCHKSCAEAAIRCGTTAATRKRQAA